jgi:hypothetical protein
LGLVSESASACDDHSIWGILQPPSDSDEKGSAVMDDTPTDGFRRRPLWLVSVAALVVAQAGLVLALFGSAWAWSALTDDRPILSGRHPLHLYHGTLGAGTFAERGATTCYDPNFQAGYPKTPVFDGGCRPAELFLTVAGGGYQPAAYKLGLFILLTLVPLVFVLAARGAGLPPGAAVLAGVGGLGLVWSAPVGRMIAEGQLDVLGASLGAVVFVPWLARFARTLGVEAWAVLAITAVLGWYFHPLLWLGLTPLVLVHYVVVAPRHGPAWHLGLAGITFVGLAPNAWWLVDWGKYWWLRQPVAGEQLPLPSWQAVVGGLADYPPLFACVPGGPVLVVAGLLGVVLLWRAGQRSAAGLLLLAALWALGVARVARAWPVLAADAADCLIVMAVGFLVPATAWAVWCVLNSVRLGTLATVLVVGGLLVVGWLDGPSRPLARALGLTAQPLRIGFTADQRELIAALQQHTTPTARILWDETPGSADCWNWSALLPLLTERAYLGGLDPEAGVAHSHCALCSRQLTGRNLSDWSDAELANFCQWYNVGWVVARTPATVDRWGRCTFARPVAQLREQDRPVVIYALDRPHSFILSGTATWETADIRRITLTNVIPNPEGVVELSLHTLDGLRVFPSYVRLEPNKDPTGRDPIDHIRLRMPGPVPRITLVWNNP